MQAVAGRDVQIFQLAGGQAAREQSRTREVVDRVVVVDALRERRTRLFGGKLEVRDKDHEVDRAVDRHADVADMAVFEQRHAEAAEDGRSRVVRMALDGRRKINDRVAVKRLAEQGVRAHDAGDRAGRGRTQTARLRDGAVLDDGQAGERLAALIVDALCTLIDEVGLVLRDELTVFIGNIDMIVFSKVDHVVHFKRDADAVIAGAHIGARSRNGNTNHFMYASLENTHCGADLAASV